ncbi:Hpt domain-containing protein [Sphingomonas sp. SUN039]|uniref:Hpt domain-containing protein n=1 Tax=Sphingomonas sp. SUN039 TaxID=2937787 RepID=UPI0021641D33|nr:Hpt domain-containing protein [Sphingomonas sp. SUN039]UVO53180.1 Hpt domain-containing protein [Sphingomonas sp. SUN039]
MAYDPGALEATLAAVAGEQGALIAELRAAFFEGADGHVTAMKAATAQPVWEQAALRLRSLAASFGLQRVMDAARDATSVPCGDARALQRIERALSVLRPADGG